MAEEDVKPEIRELLRFTMWADNPSKAEGAKRCRLAFSIRECCPWITVFTNDPADTERYGMITASMNPETFYTLLEDLATIAVGPNGNKLKLSSFTRIRDIATGKYGDKIHTCDVVAGKDENGICWISVIAANRPKIKFEYLLSDYHKFFKSDGTEMTKAESSVRQTLATVRLLKAAAEEHCIGFREKRPPSTKYANKVPEEKKVKEISFGGDVPF